MEVTWIGYELHPERAVEGEQLSQILPGVDVKAVYDRFNRTGAAYGLVFNPVDFIPNTHLALIATEYARDIGKFDVFHALVFKSFFTEGKNIGDKEVLADLMLSLGVSRETLLSVLSDPSYSERVNSNRHLGTPYQVTRLPTFIINGTEKIVGAQPYETFKRVLDKYRT